MSSKGPDFTKKALQFRIAMNEIINLNKVGKLWIQKPILANMAGVASQFFRPLGTKGCLNKSYSEWQIFVPITFLEHE